MMKLKENSPDIEVVVGPFKGRKYVQGVEYDEKQIPPMEMKHFYQVEAAPVKSAKPSKATKPTATKVEKKA
jgi:hypothetical protein